MNYEGPSVRILTGLAACFFGHMTSYSYSYLSPHTHSLRAVATTKHDSRNVEAEGYIILYHFHPSFGLRTCLNRLT